MKRSSSLQAFTLDDKLVKPALLACLMTLGLLQVQAQGVRHTVVIDKLGNKTGKIYIAWYKNAGDFRKEDKAVLQRIVEVSGKESIPLIFEELLPGTYAIAVFFDLNDNAKLDTNFFGIPKEKYGFSNNVYPLMRAASFEEAAFTVSKEATQTIHLH